MDSLNLEKDSSLQIRRQRKETLEKEVCEIEVEIRNKDGLHMRPAMKFVDIANQYDSEITVSNGESSIDGKSIMQMCTLAGPTGTKLKIKAVGKDAEDAVSALRELVESKHFDEPLPKK
jgi:phosphotransferase system HPr (HPr) family protein